MAEQYVLTDRVTSTAKALVIDDGVPGIKDSSDSPSTEPIVEDDTNSGTYWRIFISDGLIGYEQVLTVQDDLIYITDSVTGTEYLIVMEEGIFGIKSTTVVIVHRYSVIKSNAGYNINRVAKTMVVAK